MIIVCQYCSSRLQIDSEKSPSEALKIRCPKCKNTINISTGSPASDQSAFTVGDSPATEHPRYDPPTAPAYKLSTVVEQDKTSVNEEAINTLVELLSKGLAKGSGESIDRTWSRRKALICTGAQHRELIARSLTENGYQAFVAEDTRQAVETMRGNQMELVLLEAQFDVAEQGAAFVLREINVLRPAQRRRLFFVLISPSLRTMDAHAAFLNNVNAVVNINDLRDLPRILDVGLREYNELYRELNHALNLSAL
ncbi:MAG TPA: zinc-ribbon domain-containing protein [Pyrinomonadaceae bacterium]|nr:zinc-ribbon domain-containing protein [Pyrinomonadaceae bacterium]